jgi:glycosyltransferase involved in cell wall biosynthesis
LKVLFITNATNKYGASRSLGLLIEGLLKEKYLRNQDVFLVYQRYFREKKSKLELKIYEKLSNKKRWILPASIIYVGHPAGFFLRFMRFIYGLTFFFIYFAKYRKQLLRMDVDVIHINSITLWFLLLYLPKKIPVIMHVREKLELQRNRIEAVWARKVIIKRSNAIIAVSEGVSEDFISPNLFILRNPYNLERARHLKENQRDEFKEKYGIDTKKFVISLIGMITEHKGTPFFINAAEFMKEDERFQFCIVGGKDTPYSRKVTSRTVVLPNILTIPETADIEEIYAISDLVVRCEEQFSIGRTVWEAIYSGCKALIPLAEKNELSDIKSHIGKSLYFYSPRDMKSFRDAILEIAKTGIESNFIETGNSIEYSAKYWEILKRAVHKEGKV